MKSNPPLPSSRNWAPSMPNRSAHSTIIRWIACVLLALPAVGCTGLSLASKGRGVNLRITATTEHTALGPVEIGAVYVENRLSAGPDLRISIRADGTWVLSQEIEPGWFSLGMRSGPIERGVAKGVPIDWLGQPGGARVYVTGGIRAWLGRQEVTSKASEIS